MEGVPKQEKRLGTGTLSFGKHGRTVSYEEMHQLGLSKAIDEYHKLLQAGSGSSTRRRASSPRSKDNTLTLLLKFTVLHPLPGLLRPEVVLPACCLFWIPIAYALHLTIALTLPIAVWFLFTSAAGIPLPVQLINQLPPAARAVIQSFRTPEELLVRAAFIAPFLMFLSAARRTVENHEQSQWERSMRSVTHERLQTTYAGVLMPGQNPAGSAGDLSQFVTAVKALAAQVGSNDAHLPSVIGDQYSDCAAWLMKAGLEVGLAVPVEVESDASVALAALPQIKQAFLGNGNGL